MGWLFMIINFAAVVALWGARPGILFGAAIVMLAVSFATFCLMYDAPLKRAQFRIKQQMAMISNVGSRADDYQRLQSMKAIPSDDDNKFRLTAMSGANIVSGVGGTMLLAWGMFLRFAS